MSVFHLTDLIQAAALKMATIAIQRPSPIATSGDTTTFTDTNRAWTVNGLVNGTLIITRDADGAGAAPEGQMTRIASNTATALTVAAVTSAIGAGDEGLVIRAKYPLVEWRRLANVVLKSIGTVPLIDTSITLSSGITEYTLPASVIDISKVEVQTEDDSDDNHWRIIEYEIRQAAAGTQKTLVLHEDDIDSGKDLAITYLADHPTVYAYSDHIDAIPIEWASSRLAWEMINWGGINEKNKTQADKILAELNDAEQKLHILNKPPKQTKYLRWSA